MHGPRDEAGFSILELLVVLVIVSLIAGILMFGLERALDVRLRLAAFLDGTDTPTLVADWFRTSVGGMMAARGADRFVGEPRRLQGLSIAALDATAGVPTRIVWTIAYDPQSDRTLLYYRSAGGRSVGGADLLVASWPGDRGGVRYCDAALKCDDTWPPGGAVPGMLPALIELDAVRGTELWPILAAPRSGREPLPARPDVPGGS